MSSRSRTMAKRPRSRRGVTLVELMISMLILAIVCIAWLEIIGIQSARKEARRREAVERLSGMMDAFMYCNRGGSSGKSVDADGYALDQDLLKAAAKVEFKRDRSTDIVHPMFDGDVSPIGYQLCVVEKKNLPYGDKFNTDWSLGRGSRGYWLVGRLYNRSGATADAGRPFFTVSVCLGL